MGTSMMMRDLPKAVSREPWGKVREGCKMLMMAGAGASVFSCRATLVSPAEWQLGEDERAIELLSFRGSGSSGQRQPARQVISVCAPYMASASHVETQRAPEIR